MSPVTTPKQTVPVLKDIPIFGKLIVAAIVVLLGKEDMNHFIDVNDIVKFDEIELGRLVTGEGVEHIRLILDGATDGLVVFQGHPKDIYRSLLNAADTVRSKYAKLGLSHVLDQR